MKLLTTIPSDPQLEQILGASDKSVRGALRKQREHDDPASSQKRQVRVLTKVLDDTLYTDQAAQKDKGRARNPVQSELLH